MLQRVVVAPYRPRFSDENLSPKFIGRPIAPDVMPNPGSPNGDPDFITCLTRLFGEDHPIFYITCDHSGIITQRVGERLIHLGDSSQHGNITVLPGDACIIDYRPADSPCIMVLRTWDCGNVIIINQKIRRAAVVHLSVKTELGYNAEDFLAPLSARVLSLMDPPDCYAAFGPSIAGIAGGNSCWCYEYDTPDAQRLVALLRQHHPNVDQTGLFRHRPEAGKTDIAYGEMLARIFESQRLNRKMQLDFTCNTCTRCEPEEYYSNRYVREQLNNGCGPDERQQYEEQKKVRRGNLACVCFTPK